MFCFDVCFPTHTTAGLTNPSMLHRVIIVTNVEIADVDGFTVAALLVHQYDVGFLQGQLIWLLSDKRADTLHLCKI